MTRINAGLAALGAKIGTKLLPLAIKATKFLKFGKIGLAVGSIAAYTYMFTWQFALMVMIALFVHESGHIWEMKRRGYQTKGIYFIPFLGAAAVSDGTFKTRRDEAYIAIMGPIWGFVLSGIVAILYIMTGNTLFAAVAGWMAMINLFNLLPINPLDGGRIMKSITFSINSKLGFNFLIIGIILSIIVTFWAGIALFLVLLVVGSIELIFEYRYRDGNRIVNKCIESIDKLIKGDYPPEEIKNAAHTIKNILSNKEEDVAERIQKVIDIRDQEPSSENIHTIVLSTVIYDVLERYDHMPRMTIRDTIMASASYIVIAVVLWALITYTSHVPEVDIARKFFMS